MQIDDLWVECWDGTFDEDGHPNPLIKLSVEDAQAYPFEDAAPVRAPDGYSRQPNISGFRYSHKAGRHLYHESERERVDLIRLEFDPAVRRMSTQALVVVCSTGGKQHRLVPDIFTRRTDGTARIISSKTSRSLTFDRTRRVLALYEAASARLGFQHEVMTEPEPVWWANVSWLAAYSREVLDPDGLAVQMLDACAEHPHFARELFALGDEWCSRPVLFHLLWWRKLVCDLNAPFSNSTLVASAAQLAGVA